MIQDEKFESKKLIELQKELLGSNINCKNEMKKLKNIVSWIGDSTSNAYYLIINVFLMSDIFILYNLEEWRIKNGYKLEKWLEIMGEIEALVSLSTLAFEHEEWVYPSISGINEIEAKELARIIESFLDTLTTENRVIFMRRYWFSDSYKDIAEVVGLSEKNVSVRLTRIREKMKQYLIEREVFI